MSRKYTKVYSNVAVTNNMPYALPSVTIAATKLHVVRVRAPSEGRITDLSVMQDAADGTQVNFEVEILKSAIPFPFPDQDVATATAPVDSITLYRITPLQVGVATFPVEFDEQTIGYAYRNMDGTYTNNQRFIYLVIAPGGFGVGSVAASNWKISVTIETDVGGD